MRIANSMIVNNYLYAYNQSLERQHTLDEKLTDGKDIHRPSDDPVRAMRALRFRVNLGMNTEFIQHSKDAMSWMETSDSILSDLDSMGVTLKGVLVSATTKVNTNDVFQTYGNQVDGIINQMIQAGNSQIGDRYIFSGQKDKTQPFQRAVDANGNEVVVYNGDDNLISMVLQKGEVNPFGDSVNAVGGKMFGPMKEAIVDGKTVKTCGYLNDLLKIKNELMQKNVALDKRPIGKSNVNGGDMKLTGAYTGEGNPSFMMEVTSVDPATGQITGMKYSRDYNLEKGTGTWNTLTGPPFVIDGVTMNITNSEYNKAGDRYQFSPSGANYTDVQFLSFGGITRVKDGQDAVLHVQTMLGGRMSMYETSSQFLRNNEVVITGDLSANEDLDQAKALIYFKTSQVAYQAALAIGSRIMPQSLVDFLR